MGALVSKRVEALRLALPDALDLMVVCSEGGLALDQGMLKVSQELESVHPALAEEFAIVNFEMLAGKPREDALRIYTQGSAWFTFEDDKRGVLAPGRFADLAVLSGDFLTAPTQEIGNIESLLTVVGGKVVYAAGPYRDLETQQ